MTRLAHRTLPLGKLYPVSDMNHLRQAAERIATRILAKAIGPTVFEDDHFLVVDSGGRERWIFIVQATTSGNENILLLKGRLQMIFEARCDAYHVQRSSAEHGYGPLLYDTALELAYPKGLTADIISGTSAAAKRVWDQYETARPDVDHKPKTEKCPVKGVEALDQVYYKRPGLLASQVMTVAEFNKDPRVIQHLGRPATVQNPMSDMWDATPHIPGDSDD